MIPFLECPFWAEVFQIAFGGFDTVETKTATHLRPQIDRYRRIPWHWLTSQAGLTPGREAEMLNRLLAKLYRAILDVSGAGFMLDSSKDTPYGFLLAANPELDVRCFSWCATAGRSRSHGSGATAAGDAPRRRVHATAVGSGRPPGSG